jgi:5'(3')-deoxyribonucleotidase
MPYPVNSIYIDLDDVLNTYTIYQFEQFGVSISYADWPDVGFDIVAGFNLLANQNWTTNDFWSRVKREHWANVPKSDIFDLVLDRSVDLVGKKNVFLLTSPTISPDCAAGKTEWIQANLPDWMQRQTMIGACKYIASQPGRLLIDDADHNCELWSDQGGYCLLVPRPWNKNRGKDTYKLVQNALNIFASNAS